MVVVVFFLFLCFEYCLKYSRDHDCLHATAIGIIVERSMIVNQHISVHRFLDLGRANTQKSLTGHILLPRDYKGDREGIPHIHPIP